MATLSIKGGTPKIELSFTDYNAGALTSLTWRGKEFIDDTDKGRQVQTAIFFDSVGEGLNPTEAGASREFNGDNPKEKMKGDNTTHPTSSKLLGYKSYSSSPKLLPDNCFNSSTKMAWWNPVNKQTISNVLMSKQVRIGYMGLQNVIDYGVDILIPQPSQQVSPTNKSHYTLAVVESLTGYMQDEFTDFYTLMDNNTVVPLTKPNGSDEQPYPIIVTTRNKEYAMGVYTKALPQAGDYNMSQLGYGAFKYANTNKWNLVHRIANPRGFYSFRQLLAVGSFESVTKDMIKLRAL